MGRGERPGRGARCGVHPAPQPDLAGFGVHGAAPEYWRRAQAPVATPGGRPIPAGPSVGTLQEGLALVQADRGAMLLCHPTADYYGRRAVTFVPLTGLQDSFLGLVWHRDQETARTRALSQALAAVAG